MEHPLDVRDLEAPAPLERILDALADLPDGDSLCVRLRREPYPLYVMLRQMGYRWRCTRKEAGDVEVRIWEASAPDPTDRT